MPAMSRSSCGFFWFMKMITNPSVTKMYMILVCDASFLFRFLAFFCPMHVYAFKA